MCRRAFLPQSRQSMSHIQTNRLRLRLASLSLIIIGCLALSTPAFSHNTIRSRGGANFGRKARSIDLRNIDRLNAAFKRDNDKVRVVVLVSPT